MKAASLGRCGLYGHAWETDGMGLLKEYLQNTRNLREKIPGR